MSTLFQTLNQLDTNQLKKLAKEFKVATTSNRKPAIIMSLIQHGGDKSARLPSIYDDPAMKELAAIEAAQIEAERILDERLDTIATMLENRVDVLEYIIGQITRGTIGVDDKKFDIIQSIHLEAIDYQEDLRSREIDENLVNRIENFLNMTERQFKALKRRYYNR